MSAPDAVLDVIGLSVTYSGGFSRSPVTAASDVSFTVGRGETVSIVGESGSGKTTIGSAILGLQPVAKGSILLNGADITHLNRRERRAHSVRPFKPFSKTPSSRSIRPRPSARPSANRCGSHDRSWRLRPRVGRSPRRSIASASTPASRGDFPPSSRVDSASASRSRALILKPEIVVCDEAVSAPDVSVQAQVLNLLESLQRDEGVSYVFISHNMAAVRHISDRIVALYRGRVMEEGSAEDICDRPRHPYTRSLIAAVPAPDVWAQRERRRVRGLAAAAAQVRATPGTGCPFAPRCPFAADICAAGPPPLIEVDGGRRIACVRIDEIPPQISTFHSMSREPGTLAMTRAGNCKQSQNATLRCLHAGRLVRARAGFQFRVEENRRRRPAWLKGARCLYRRLWSGISIYRLCRAQAMANNQPPTSASLTAKGACGRHRAHQRSAWRSLSSRAQPVIAPRMSRTSARRRLSAVGGPSRIATRHY
ncbi:MAG TPA: ABC transporter ATP-binding protein [Roseiarcus sp.]|nr:ABC transporter ATP-binding protein [Roseiarcus sp.]